MTTVKLVMKDFKPASEKLEPKKDSFKQIKIKKKTAKNLQKKFENDIESSELTEKFISTKIKNIAIMNEKKHATFSGKLDKDIIERADDENPELLINSGSDIFFKFSTETYAQFAKIKYMEIHLKIELYEDGQFEDGSGPWVFTDKMYNIPNINTLCDYMIIRKGLLLSMNMYTEGPGWYSSIETEETASILYKNGKAEKIPFYQFMNMLNIAL